MEDDISYRLIDKRSQTVEFYKLAFGTIEVYRVDAPDGDVVSRLSIDGAEFWLSDESPEHGNFSPETLGGGSVRMILTRRIPTPCSRKRSITCLRAR